MYVCLCHGVTDQHIREAIDDGCDNYRAIRETLKVGTKCGKCACDAKCLVRESTTGCQNGALECLPLLAASA